MTLEQRPDDRFIHRQHPDVVNADGPARFLRAAGEKRRRGIDADGMPMASEVVVRSLDGTVLRTEAPQTAVARRPLGLHVVPIPEPTGPEPQPEPDQPSYSFAVAFRYAQMQADLPKHHTANDGGFTVEIFARRTGVNFVTAAGWQARGTIPRDAADTVAVALGVHPVMLWPEWLADGLAEADLFDSERKVRERDRTRRLRLGWEADEPTSVDWRRELRNRMEAQRMRNKRSTWNAKEHADKAEYLREYRARRTEGEKQREAERLRRFYERNPDARERQNESKRKARAAARRAKSAGRDKREAS